MHHLQGKAFNGQKKFREEAASQDQHVEAAMAKVKELEAVLSLTKTEKVVQYLDTLMFNLRLVILFW